MIKQRLFADDTADLLSNTQRELRGWALGYLPLVGAVELLCTCTVSARLVEALAGRDAQGHVWLDVEHGLARARDSGLSGGERRVALLVLELAEVDTGADLGGLLAGLEDADVAAFLNAAALCAGWADRDVEAHISGVVGDE